MGAEAVGAAVEFDFTSASIFAEPTAFFLASARAEHIHYGYNEMRYTLEGSTRAKSRVSHLFRQLLLVVLALVIMCWHFMYI